MSEARGYRFLEPEALARVKKLALVARGVVEGYLTGLHSSPSKGFSIEFAEHRKYTPGDGPRHLDWRVLARTDRLYIKQYEEETNLRAHLLIDASASMGYRGPDSSLSKLEYACHVAAVLAYLLVRQQDAVGLTAFDTKIRQDVPPAGSPRHFDMLMKRLESLRSGEGTALAGVLHRLADRAKRRSLIILLSDLYEEPEALESALHHFRHKRHEVMVIQVLDPAERTFPFREPARFVDAETGETIQVDPSYAGDDYRARMDAFLTRCRRLCADSQADHVLADTSTRYEHLLARFLQARARP
jgi:uncharacterized protein (DUF58 family)